jgi:hypothetical protein
MATRTTVRQTTNDPYAQAQPGDPERADQGGSGEVPRPPGDHNVWPASLTEKTSDGDPSFDLTPSGRRPKSPSPGVPEPRAEAAGAGAEVDPQFSKPIVGDPTVWDPRHAPFPGTPIAFPDPDDQYPQEGTPYPVPPDPVVGTAFTQAAKALNEDGTRKDAEGGPSGSGKSDADVASREANLGGRPSRQYDT